MIEEVAFTAYPAANVGKLRKWYEDTLGLKFSGRTSRTASKGMTNATSAAAISA